MIIRYGIFLLMLFCLKAHAQNDIRNYTKLTIGEINILEKKFNWDRDMLVVNFYLPVKYKDNSKDNFLANKENWNNFYQKLDKENVDIKFVYSDCSNRSQQVTDRMFFVDEENFIRNTFLSDTKACYGVIVINKKGNYKIKMHDYSIKDISIFIDELR